MKDNELRSGRYSLEHQQPRQVSPIECKNVILYVESKIDPS